MKLTKSKLRALIKEELENALLDEEFEMLEEEDPQQLDEMPALAAIGGVAKKAWDNREEIGSAVSDTLGKGMDAVQSGVDSLTGRDRPVAKIAGRKAAEIARRQAAEAKARARAKARADKGYDEGVIDPNSPEEAMKAGRKADIESGLVGPGEHGGADALEAGEQWDDPTGRAIALGNMSWDARRRAINNAFKAGKIDKNEWRRLRRRNWEEKPGK
jgi:hypothetical protein